MGNTKIFRFEFPLYEGEAPPLQEDLRTWASTHDAVVGEVSGFSVRRVMGCLTSMSMVADAFIRVLRERYPNRWMKVERYDTDWSDFRVYRYADGVVETLCANNWHVPAAAAARPPLVVPDGVGSNTSTDGR